MKKWGEGRWEGMGTGLKKGEREGKTRGWGRREESRGEKEKGG